MKFCPTCETQYDEEILRFCTKDGTPLVDENQPNFTEMPSESFEASEADLGEETIVRYKPPKDILPEPDPQPEIERSEAPRIVISTSEQQKRDQNVRSRQIPPYQAIPPKPNRAATSAMMRKVTAQPIMVLPRRLMGRPMPTTSNQRQARLWGSAKKTHLDSF